MNNSNSAQKRSIKVPDLPDELHKDQGKFKEYNTSNIPPFICTTESLITEKFNSSPYLLRASHYILPLSEYALSASGIPFSVIVQPFADRGDFCEVNELNYCKNCRTYFNCFTRTEDYVSICNICACKNENTKSNSIHLNHSSLEYTLPSQIKNHKSSPIFVFAIDLSSFLVNPKLFDKILEICNDPNFQQLYEHVLFICINNNITLFSKSNNRLCLIKILGEMSTVSPKLLIKSTDSESISLIMNFFKNESPQPINNRPLLEFLEIIKNVSTWTLGLKVALYSAYKPIEINFELFLNDVKNASINIFASSKQESLSFLHSLAFYTGGKLFSYQPEKECDTEAELVATAIVRSAYNVSIIAKTSDNLVKTNIISQSLDEKLSSTELNHMDSNSSVLYTFSLSGQSNNMKYIQIQIFFTDFDGKEKIRILNHSFSTGNPQQVFSCMSFDSIFTSLCKQVICDSSIIEDYLIKILVYYRKKISASANSSQFVLPYTVKCLPVLIQSFNKKHTKNKAEIISMNVEQTLRYFYPRLFGISDYDKLVTTKNTRLSIENIKDDEIYILENAQTIYIYVPQNVDPVLINRIFDFKDDGKNIEIKHSGEEEAEFVNSILEDITMHYNYKLKLKIIFANQSSEESEFLGYMVEDAINNCKDYVDFIFQIHFDVQKG